MPKTYYLDPHIKFRLTRFRFRNRAERDRFFDDLVINNILSYPRVFREWFFEGLELRRSYMILSFSVVAFTGLTSVLFLSSGNLNLVIINIIIALSSLVAGLILRLRINRLYGKFLCTEAINESEGMLDLIRESRIEWLREEHPERLRAVGYTEDQ